MAIRERGLYTADSLRKQWPRSISGLRNKERLAMGDSVMTHFKSSLFLNKIAIANLSWLLWMGGFSAGASAQPSAAAAPAPSTSSIAPLDLQISAGYQYDDNVTRAGSPADKLSDHSLSVDLSKRIIFSLNDHARALLNFNLGGEEFRNFDGLSRLTAGVQGELQYRGSAVFEAPTFALFGRIATEQYRSELRDGFRYTAGVSVRQSLTDRISYFGALAYHWRNADNVVFDNQEYAARLNLDYILTPSQTLYLGAEYRRGDIVTTASGPVIGGPGSGTTLVRNDDAYPGRRLTTYRIDGDTLLTTLGYNLAINADSSLDFSWRRVRATPDSPGVVSSLYSRYVTNQFAVAYLLRF